MEYSDMFDAFICDYVRTPIGKYGGSLSAVRADDLAAIPLRSLAARSPNLDITAIDEVYFGCANQAGEDNRNVARMSLLLAGYPECVPGSTINRLCGSGMDALIVAARSIRAGEIDMAIAGGVESMSRAPFVLPKAESAYTRSTDIFDTTIGWRFINPRMESMYGVASMPETAENVAADFGISRLDQDLFALQSQERASVARENGRISMEIVPAEVPGPRDDVETVEIDEHPRKTSMDKLAALKAPFRDNGTVTAGNSSGINDGAAALLIANAEAVKRNGLTPIARVLGGASFGVYPNVMGIGPVDATRKLCHRLRKNVLDFDVIELNEAFASQAVAVLRELDLDPMSPHINPNGGAIAYGHPLGMSGARLAGTAALELREKNAKLALATMCVGVGQGIAVALERA